MDTHNVRRANFGYEYELADPDAILTHHMQDLPTGNQSPPQRRVAAT
ncbi:hypothetical protein ABZV29_22995 [Streptomyces sp. NPDC005236]